jgi:tRNA(adenine34) deaminase
VKNSARAPCDGRWLWPIGRGRTGKSPSERRSADPTSHAEVAASRQAASRQAAAAVANYRLPGTILYVALEACAMCAGVIVHGRVSRVVFGAFRPKGGAVRSVFALLDSAVLNRRRGMARGRAGRPLWRSLDRLLQGRREQLWR